MTKRVWLRTVLGATVGCVLSLTPVVRDAQAGFSQPTQVSSEPAFPLTAGVDQYGHAYAAWAQYPYQGPGCPSTATSRIMLADRRPGGRWNVRQVTPLGASDPTLGVAPSGRVGLAWITGDLCNGGESRTGTLVAATAAPGRPIGPGQVVTEHAVLFPPSARGVASSRDETVVVWEDAATGRIMLSSSRDDRAFSSPQALSPGGGRFPQVAVNPAGAVVVAWQVGAGGAGGTSVQYTYRRPGGAFDPVSTVMSGGSYGPVRPMVAINGSGDAVVAFYAGPEPMTYVAVQRASGRRIPARPLVRGTPEPSAVGMSGFAIAVTYNHMFREFEHSLIGSSDGGETFGPAETMPPPTPSGPRGTLVDAAANAMTLWAGPPREATTLVEASRPAGGTWGPSTPVGDRVENMAIAGSGTGNVVAVWRRGEGEPGDGRVMVADGVIVPRVDDEPPTVTVSRTKRGRRHLELDVICGEPCVIRATARGRVARRTFSARAQPLKASLGEPRRLTAPLPRAAQRGRRIRVTVVVEDLAGNVSRTTLTT